VKVPTTASGKKIGTTNPLTVVLTAAQNSTGNNFGYIGGSISGYAYYDANANGAKDSGEPGIGGGGDHPPTPRPAPNPAARSSATSASDASYHFTGLAAGSYSVTAPSTAAGKMLNTTNPLTPAIVEGGANTGNNFGYVTGSIAGTVYYDANQNGAKDGGETSI